MAPTVFLATDIEREADVQAAVPAGLNPWPVMHGEIWYGTQLLGDDETTDVKVLLAIVIVVVRPVFKFNVNFKYDPLTSGIFANKSDRMDNGMVAIM